jgi:hypothetical protein
MSGNARPYLRPGAVERIFGRILVSLIRIGLVRGHFYVLEVRGRQSGRTISLPVDDRSRRAAVSGLRPRQRELGAQCPCRRRSDTRPRAAPPALCCV